MQPKKIIIPDGVQFADLALERDPITKRLLCKPEPLAKLFMANEIALQTLFDDEDVVCWLVAEFYVEHRQAGGEPDSVAEDVVAEVASLHRPDLGAATAWRE